MAASVVQAALAIGAGPSFTLGTAPTAGNALIALTTNYSSNITVAAGWTQLYVGANASDYLVRAFYKLVGESESTTQSPFTDSNGSAAALFEVSPILSVMLNITDINETNEAVISTTTPTETGLFLGLIATTGNNELPAITGATTEGTLQGTASKSSPLSATALSQSLTASSATVTGTYTAARNTYLMSVIVAEDDGTSFAHTERIVRETMGSNPDGNARVSRMARETMSGVEGYVHVTRIVRETMRSRAAIPVLSQAMLGSF